MSLFTEKRDFWFSADHAKHQRSLPGPCDKITFCKLDTGEIREFTCACDIGSDYVGRELKHFPDYIFLGTGVHSYQAAQGKED